MFWPPLSRVGRRVGWLNDGSTKIAQWSYVEARENVRGRERMIVGEMERERDGGEDAQKAGRLARRRSPAKMATAIYSRERRIERGGEVPLSLYH